MEEESPHIPQHIVWYMSKKNSENMLSHWAMNLEASSLQFEDMGLSYASSANALGVDMNYWKSCEYRFQFIVVRYA